MSRPWGIVVGAAGLLLATASPASATTFCVPDNSIAACPSGSTPQANLETAMQSNATDGNADTIVIGPGTQTETVNGTFETSGTDALEIVGAGPGTGVGATRLTSNGTVSQFVMSLNSRPTTLRNLTVVIPASFPDDQGAGLYAGSGTIQNVDIESQNGRSDAVTMAGNSSFSDGEIYGAGAGSIGTGFLTAGANGSVTVTRTTIRDSIEGASLTNGGQVFNLRRSRIVNPVAAGVLVGASGIGNVTNAVIETNGQGSALEVSQFSAGATAILSANHVTAVRTSGVDAIGAIRSIVNGTTGSTNLVVDDSIIRGYANSYARTSTGTGFANLAIRYSDLAPTGANSGPGNLALSNNINADPLFAGPGDFHLPAGSPAIDAANPLPSAVVTDDFDGEPRPVDGNGDGVAVRDMGAYEFQGPPASTPPPGGNPPTSTPAAKRKCKKKKAKKRSASAAKKKKCKKKKRRR